MGTTSSVSPTFNGSSTYAAQLQQVITSAVANASAPIQQLESQQTSLSNQQQELQTLSKDFQSLQSAISAIESATGSGAYTASLSDTSVASSSLSAGVMPGSYTLSVSSIGSQTSTLSNDGLALVSDPSSTNIDTSSSYVLSVNGQQYSISDASGSLTGLVDAINSSGANVQATIVNVGGSSTPDYRLSIQSNNYSPDTIQLSDGQQDLLQTLSTGSYVTYQVNGEPSSPITSDSREVTISPGLTANILQAGTTAISVGQDTTSLSDALNSFASAYNAVVSELDKNRGQNGGALSGQSIVYELQSELSNLASYTSGTGAASSLSQLGLTFDQNGNLQFDASTFAALAGQSPGAITNFLGSPTGGGFLQAAANMLSSATDPTSGMLADASSSITGEISSISTKISDDQSKLSALQQSLTSQMASADSTISLLQNQVTEMTNLFVDMQQYDRSSNG
jgi:flagellar hook-associated protein 2